jgi:integrase
MSTIFRRNKTFYYSYFKDGKRYLRSLKTKDRKTASILQSKFDVDLEQEFHRFKIDKCVSDYLDWYEKNHLAHLKPFTAKKDLMRIKNFLEETKVKKLSHITQDLIQEWLLKKKIGPKTWNNIRGTIRTFISKAVPHYLGHNPADKISFRKVPQTHVDFYTDEEYLKIESAAEKYFGGRFKDMVVIARYTGLRLGEILHLEGKDIIWAPKPLVYVKNKPELSWTVKNYQVRAIPLSKEAVAKLGHLKKKTGLLFPSTLGKAYKDLPEPHINRILETAGVKRPGRAWHLLRHTFASRAVQNGISLPLLRSWLGHSDFKTTLRYAHLAPEYSPEIEKINIGTAIKIAINPDFTT